MNLSIGNKLFDVDDDEDDEFPTENEEEDDDEEDDEGNKLKPKSPDPLLGTSLVDDFGT